MALAFTPPASFPSFPTLGTPSHSQAFLSSFLQSSPSHHPSNFSCYKPPNPPRRSLFRCTTTPDMSVPVQSRTSNQDTAVSPQYSTSLTRPDPHVILVIGASGNLGRNIVKRLVDQPGCIVIACVKSQSEAAEAGLLDVAESLAPRSKDSAFGRRPTMLKFLNADLSEDISHIVEHVRLNSVGTVVFAASGGQQSQPAAIDNAAVGQLVRALEPYLGAAGEARELPIFDFGRNGSKEVAAFRSVDDRVMGGISESRMIMAPVGESAFFRGNVTTASNGGFAQARGNFGTDGNGDAARIDLSQYAGIAIRCRGDGRRYKLNLKDNEAPEYVFQASFGTVDGEWQVVRLPFSDFLPVRRGKIAYRDGPGPGIYASTLNTDNVVSLGIVVSKIEMGGETTPGFESGPFELEVSQISAYRASTPRFVLISSAAVTRPFWNQAQNASAPRAAGIPIVKLNPSNILGHKLAGENAVRRSGIPWTIVRPIGLNDSVPCGGRLLVRQGDTLTGTFCRADAARGIVSALTTPASTWKTFELGARNDNVGTNDVIAESEFAALDRDTLEAPYAQETDSLIVE